MTSFFNKAALLAATAVAFATPSFAQSTSVEATGHATVKLYTPLSIVKNTAAGDTVDFGVLVGTTSGATPRGDYTFSISPTVAPTAASVCTGASTENWTCGGTPKRAGFDVNGSADALVSLTLSAQTITLVRQNLTAAATSADQIDLDLKLSESDQDVTVDKPAGDGIVDMTLDSSGAGTVYVGGDLKVLAANPDGVYKGDFTLTADYQ